MPTPTVQSLGQRVRLKYPGQYDDMSDLAVGQKVKAKFPGEYDDFVDLPVMHSSETTGDLRPGRHPKDSLGGPPARPLTYGEKVGRGYTGAMMGPTGGGMGETLAQALLHPIDTVMGIPGAIKDLATGDPDAWGGLAATAPFTAATPRIPVRSLARAGAAGLRGAYAESAAPAQLPTIRVKGVPITKDAPVSAITANAVSGAGAGAAAGAYVGHPVTGAVIGAGVGAARPIVRGFRKGTAALREADAAAARPPRPTPAWRKQAQETVQTDAPVLNATPIPSTLPSGRIPGPAPARPAPLPRPAPAWRTAAQQAIAGAETAPSTSAATPPAQPPVLPSGRVPGRFREDAVTHRTAPAPAPAPTQAAPAVTSPVTPSSRFQIDVPAGQAEHYGETGQTFGNRRATNAASKDAAIIKHLAGKGITLEQFASANEALRNTWLKQVNAETGTKYSTYRGSLGEESVARLLKTWKWATGGGNPNY